ncbi:hypothetical protein F2Q68_00023808 [Brassica cretica]|uniref:Uncharacterized protein n=1 Tax=Brassica cretica TaxID=69181 RepID=A0A8S9IEA8_BRACR|nr:hypothetical protein F2Q68_00023808 [Brassica cretica]
MLSMRLAAVNPRTDFNLDSILASQNGSLMDGSFNGESYHQLQQWSLDGYHQPAWGREEDHHEGNFLMGSATLHPNQVEKNDHELTLALYNSERLNNSVNSP